MPDPSESAEEAVSRLTKELDELKLRHAAVCEERDRLAVENADLRDNLAEQETTRAAVTALIGQLQDSMESLRDSMVEYNAILELPEVKAYLAAKLKPTANP